MQCASRVSVGDTRRNGAFNPGTFGAGAGDDPCVFLAARLDKVIRPMLFERAGFLAHCVASGALASRDASLVLLLWVSSFVGPFLGYQVCLDIGCLYPSLFNEAAVVECGPGAVAILREVYGLSHTGGMERRRSSQLSAVPLCFLLSEEIRTSSRPAAVRLRDVCRKLFGHEFNPADVEYWSCEVRQLEARLANDQFRDPRRAADQWYLNAMESPFFTTWFRCRQGY